MTLHKRQYLFEAEVLRIVDGDTIDVRVDLGFETDRRMRLRFARIDTPELNSRDPDVRVLAQQAKRFVEVSCPVGSTILFYSVRTKKDGFGRYFAEIFLDPREPISLNQILLDEGLAVLYEKGK